jgi:ubiquinone/menaquinone biosynthesis C-methylase UbiE
LLWNGEFTLWLAETGVNATGIDISPVSIANATRLAEQQHLSDKAKFLVMDAEATSFPDAHFDFAVVNGVLHHLDLEKAYRELARILKPGGAVICTEALKHNVLIHLYRKMTPHLRSVWETEHILGKSEIDQAKPYFEKVEVSRFFHLATLAAVPFRKTPVFASVLKTLTAMDSVLLKVPFLQWQAWMAVFVLSNPRKSAAV